MRYSTTAIVLAAMFIGEAVAGPTHVHRHRHEKKDQNYNVDAKAIDWGLLDINWVSAYDQGQAAKTSSSATPTATASATSITSSSSTRAPKSHHTSPPSTEDPCHGLVGASNDRTSFGEVVAPGGGTTDGYRGNCGNPYGSNMFIVPKDSEEHYKYTVKFFNTQEKAICVNIWNKMGSDGQSQSGQSLAPKDTSLTIALKPGEPVTVAFDEDTQAAFTELVEKIRPWGGYDNTIGELQFSASHGGVGFDMSAIVNSAGNAYNMTLFSDQSDCKSDPNNNFWLSATEAKGTSDGSCYLKSSTAHLTVIMGGPL